MRDQLTSKLLGRLGRKEKPYEVRDTRLKGFLVRVQPTGAMTFYVEAGRGRRIALGRVGVADLDEARNQAKLVIAEVYQGKDPVAALRKAKSKTLRSFIDDVYAPWARANLRTAEATVARLKSSFASILDAKLGGLTAWQVERWRAARLAAGAKPTTVNRDFDDLRSSLSKAVTWGLLTGNPIAAVKRLRGRLERVSSLPFE